MIKDRTPGLNGYIDGTIMNGEGNSLLCPFCRRPIFNSEYYVSYLPQGYSHYLCIPTFPQESVLRNEITVKPIPVILDIRKSDVLQYLRKMQNGIK